MVASVRRDSRTGRGDGGQRHRRAHQHQGTGGGAAVVGGAQHHRVSEDHRRARAVDLHGLVVQCAADHDLREARLQQAQLGVVDVQHARAAGAATVPVPHPFRPWPPCW